MIGFVQIHITSIQEFTRQCKEINLIALVPYYGLLAALFGSLCCLMVSNTHLMTAKGLKQILKSC